MADTTPLLTPTIYRPTGGLRWYYGTSSSATITVSWDASADYATVIHEIIASNLGMSASQSCLITLTINSVVQNIIALNGKTLPFIWTPYGGGLYGEKNQAASLTMAWTAGTNYLGVRTSRSYL